MQQQTTARWILGIGLSLFAFLSSSPPLWGHPTPLPAHRYTLQLHIPPRVPPTVLTITSDILFSEALFQTSAPQLYPFLTQSTNHTRPTVLPPLLRHCRKAPKRCPQIHKIRLTFTYKDKTFQAPWPIAEENAAFFSAIFQHHPDPYAFLHSLIESTNTPNKAAYQTRQRLLRSLFAYTRQHAHNAHQIAKIAQIILRGMSESRRDPCHGTLSFFYRLEPHARLIQQEAPIHLRDKLQHAMYSTDAPWCLGRSFVGQAKAPSLQQTQTFVSDQEDWSTTPSNDSINQAHPSSAAPFKHRWLLRAAFRYAYKDHNETQRSQTIASLAKIFQPLVTPASKAQAPQHDRAYFRTDTLIEETDPEIRKEETLRFEMISDPLLYRQMILRIIRHLKISTPDPKQRMFAHLQRIREQYETLRAFADDAFHSCFDPHDKTHREILHDLILGANQQQTPTRPLLDVFLADTAQTARSPSASPILRDIARVWGALRGQTSFDPWHGYFLLAALRHALGDDVRIAISTALQVRLLRKILRYTQQAACQEQTERCQTARSFEKINQTLMTCLIEWRSFPVARPKQRLAELSRQADLLSVMIEQRPYTSPSGNRTVLAALQKQLPRWLPHHRIAPTLHSAYIRIQQFLLKDLQTLASNGWKDTSPSSKLDDLLRLAEQIGPYEDCQENKWLSLLLTLHHPAQQPPSPALHKKLLNTAVTIWGEKHHHCPKEQLSEDIKNKFLHIFSSDTYNKSMRLALESKLSLQKATAGIMQGDLLQATRQVPSLLREITSLRETTHSNEKRLLTQWAKLLLQRDLPCDDIADHLSISKTLFSDKRLRDLREMIHLQTLLACVKRRAFFGITRLANEESNAAAEAIERLFKRAFSHASPYAWKHMQEHLYRTLKSPVSSALLNAEGRADPSNQEARIEKIFSRLVNQERARWPDAVGRRRLEIALVAWSTLAQLRLARSHDLSLAQQKQDHPNDQCTATPPLHPLAFQANFQHDLDAIQEINKHFRRSLKKEQQRQAQTSQFMQRLDKERKALQSALEKAEEELAKLRHQANVAGLEAQAALYAKEIAQSLEQLAKQNTLIARSRKTLAEKRNHRKNLEIKLQEHDGKAESIQKKILQIEQQIMRQKKAGHAHEQRLLQAQAEQVEQERQAHQGRQKKLLELWELRIEEDEIALNLLRQEIVARKHALQAVQHLAQTMIQQADHQIASLAQQIQTEQKKRFWKGILVVGCTLLGAVVGGFIAGKPQLGLQAGAILGNALGKGVVDKDWKGALFDTATEGGVMALSFAVHTPQLAHWLQQTTHSKPYTRPLKTLLQETRKALKNLPSSLSAKEKRRWLRVSFRRLVGALPAFAHRDLAPAAYLSIKPHTSGHWRTLLEATFDFHQKVFAQQLARFPLLSKEGMTRLAAHHGLYFLRHHTISSGFLADLQAWDKKYPLFPTTDEILKNHTKDWSKRWHTRVKSFSNKETLFVWTKILYKTKQWHPQVFARLARYAPTLLRKHQKYIRSLRRVSKSVLYPLMKANALHLALQLLPHVVDKLGYNPKDKADFLSALFSNNQDILRGRFASWIPILRALLEQDALALVKHIHTKLHEKKAHDAWKTAVEKAEESFRQTLASALSYRADAASVNAQNKPRFAMSYLAPLQVLEKELTALVPDARPYTQELLAFQFHRWANLQERLLAFQKKNPSYKNYLYFLHLPKKEAVRLLAQSLQTHHQEQGFSQIVQELRQKIADSSAGWNEIKPEAQRRLRSLYPRLSEMQQKQKLLHLQTLTDPSILQRLYTTQVARFQKRLLQEKEKIEASLRSDQMEESKAAYQRFRNFVQKELPRYITEAKDDLSRLERKISTKELQTYKQQLRAEVQKQEGRIDLQKAQQAYLRYQQSIARMGWKREILALREEQAALSLRKHQHRIEQRMIEAQQLRSKKEEMNLRLDEATLLLKGQNVHEQIAEKQVSVQEILHKVQRVRQHYFQTLIKKKRLQIATLHLRLRQFSAEKYKPQRNDLFSSTWDLAALQDLRAHTLARMGESLRAAHRTMRCLGLEIPHQNKAYYGKETEHFPLYMQNQFNELRNLWVNNQRGVRCKDNTFHFSKERNTRFREAIEAFQETGRLQLAPSYEDLDFSEEEKNIKIKEIRVYLDVESDQRELVTNMMNTQFRLFHPADHVNLIHWRGHYLATLQGKQPNYKDSIKGQINFGSPPPRDICTGATYSRFSPPADVNNSLLYLSPFTRWDLRVTSPKSRKHLRRLKIKSLRIQLFYLE